MTEQNIINIVFGCALLLLFIIVEQQKERMKQLEKKNDINSRNG